MVRLHMISVVLQQTHFVFGSTPSDVFHSVDKLMNPGTGRESSLCFGYAFVLVAELFGGWNALACVPSHSKFLWQATRRYIYWNLRSLGIQRTLAAHNPGSGYCNNWQSAAFTATNKLQYNSAVCGGRKAKNQWISTPVVVATGHVIHAILDSYSWGKKSHEEEAWCVCSTVEFMQVN
jgi:hypothetical protein